MIIVTGGAGFIGSNLVKALNLLGRTDIIVIDDLTDGRKFRNLVDCEITDYFDKNVDINDICASNPQYQNIDIIFHQGACSTTTEWNGQFMMNVNYDYSKHLLSFAQNRNIPFIYASSAAIYGASQSFSEHPSNEKPLNVYGYSKLLFDQYVRRLLPKSKSQIVGLRYFNVYGPREFHKDSMASVAYHNHKQVLEHNVVKLFEGHAGYGPGEQRRDFIYVGDVAKVLLWFMRNQNISGIYNVGTGRSQTFNDVSNAVISWHGHGSLEYIAFPEHLKKSYQSFTEADISLLRQAGYQEPFRTVEEGVKEYLDWLAEQE